MSKKEMHDVSEEKLDPLSINQKVFHDLSELSVLVVNNVPLYRLEFVEHNDDTNRSYPTDVRFKNVIFLNSERVVLNGSHWKFGSNDVIGTINIEYEFSTQKFYMVNFSEKTLRTKRIHKLIPHNKKEIMELIDYIASRSYIHNRASQNGEQL